MQKRHIIHNPHSQYAYISSHKMFWFLIKVNKCQRFSFHVIQGYIYWNFNDYRCCNNMKWILAIPNNLVKTPQGVQGASVVKQSSGLLEQRAIQAGTNGLRRTANSWNEFAQTPDGVPITKPCRWFRKVFSLSLQILAFQLFQKLWTLSEINRSECKSHVCECLHFLNKAYTFCILLT